MKKTILILTALLLTGAASAQKHEKNIFSVRGGMNVASMTASMEGVSVSSASRTGYHFGIADEIRIGRYLPFYLETGLSISSRGGKEEGASLRPLYLQVPLLLNYHFNIKNVVTIQPFAGLYYGFGIAGDVKENNIKVDMFGKESNLQRSDLGVRLGAGFVCKRIYFGVSYDIGCMDLLKNGVGDQFGTGEKTTMHANCLTLTVGYNF